MSDLASWLLEQVAEDERIARGVVPEPEKWPGSGHWVVARKQNAAAADGKVKYRHEVRSGYGDIRGDFISQLRGGVAACEHAATFDPARVLAECEAKRRIIEVHAISSGQVLINAGEGAHHLETMFACAACGGLDPGRQGCETISLLALPFADRPGYDERWRP